MNQSLQDDFRRGGYVSEIIRRLGILEKSMRDVLSGSGGGGGGCRECLTANRTYYVRTDGDDANNGLTNDAAGAFLTVQHAVDVCTTLDLSGYTVTIQLADGAYNADNVLKNVVGYSAPGDLIIQGNAATPANVTITTGTCFYAQNISSIWRILDMKLSATNYCLVAANAMIQFGNLNFAASAGSHIVAHTNGAIAAISDYAVSGNAVRHLWAETGGFIQVATRTIVFSNNPVFTVFCYEFNLGDVQANAMTFTNKATVTAKRYDVTLNSVCFTNGGGAAYFPGATAGTTATGGQYN